jgi:electron transport complex protein RnfD
VLTEHLLCKAARRASSVGDLSAVVTGLLYALTLPPHLPLWMVALGGVVAVALGKMLFGGLGGNVFNPALVGRAFLQAAFPVAMTHWWPAFNADRFAALPSPSLTLPFAQPLHDAVSAATPLAAFKFSHVDTAVVDLLLGNTAGALGETCALALLAGGVYLALRRVLDWRIPLALLGVVAAGSVIANLFDPARYATAEFMLFSGGLMLGAWFMATDPVGAPLTARGRVLFGAIIGALVLVVRWWGGMPEGVMYAILLGNALTPLLDRVTRPRTYGHT